MLADAPRGAVAESFIAMTGALLVAGVIPALLTALLVHLFEPVPSWALIAALCLLMLAGTWGLWRSL